MTTYNDLFEDVLLKKINATLIEVSKDLMSGNLTDFSAYKELTGYVRGLMTIETLCAEVRQDMEKR